MCRNVGIQMTDRLVFRAKITRSEFNVKSGIKKILYTKCGNSRTMAPHVPHSNDNGKVAMFPGKFTMAKI